MRTIFLDNTVRGIAARVTTGYLCKWESRAVDMFWDTAQSSPTSLISHAHWRVGIALIP